MHATIDVRLTVRIDDDKTIPLATLAKFITSRGHPRESYVNPWVLVWIKHADIHGIESQLAVDTSSPKTNISSSVSLDIPAFDGTEYTNRPVHLLSWISSSS